jgi:hypothetical protein
MGNGFPDQPYLDRIRASLWRRGPHGNAAVMVGAGMSLNARPRAAGSARFPTWSDLARTVVEHLYPESSSPHRKEALEQARATSGFLRVALEYETAFGPEALERLIEEAVPDLRFEPGDLHQRLLMLPWSDVFTTNWDTLLERAATRIVDRHYHVVRTAADIPASVRPRIVKLHGTLSVARPLIFTEEDFRTYPVRFAPFVNLAQQSMMESVFCLVGFSGDDPNFLYWSGWVRDHLKDYAPRIYLVGWLDLPPQSRRMLERRGVVAVDLAKLPVPGPRWPEETREQRAVEWFLKSLEDAEPYKEIAWPEVRDRRARDAPSYLPRVPVEESGFPRAEPAGPDAAPDVLELRRAVEVWRHNRRLYPGWIVAPPFARRSLWSRTQQWLPAVLDLLPGLPPAEAIEVLEELNWRLETSLVPLTAKLVLAIGNALAAVDPFALPVMGPISQGGSEGTLRQRWVALGAALLRAAREEDDDAAFARWANAVIPHLPDHPWLRPRMAYERCLLGLYRLDHAAVERSLDDLDTAAGDVFWKVRKAAILAELGKTEEAFRLAREALSEIRQQLGHSCLDIPTLSRESWAMVLAEGFRFYPRPREPVQDLNSPPSARRGLEPPESAARRWEVLQRHGCDAREDHWETLRLLLSEPPQPEPEIVEGRDFDPWQRTRIAHGLRWSSDADWEHLPGLQAKRLVEEAGLPPVVDHYDLAKTLLLRTAVWLAAVAPGAAMAGILRVSDYEEDETFDGFFNRSRVGLLGESQIHALVERASRALDYGVPRAAAAMTEGNGQRASYWAGRTRVAVELLSRITLRLDGERAERILHRALDYYQLPLFRQHAWLSKPLGHLFARVLAVLEPSRIESQLTRLLALPLNGEGDFRPQGSDWPDPFQLAAGRLGETPPALPSVPEWNQAIDRLLAAAAITPVPFPRWPAIHRLRHLLDWGLLTEQQETALGQAVWRFRLLGSGFPEGPWPPMGLDFIFLFLPSPEEGIAERLFRERYLTGRCFPPDGLPPVGWFHNLLGAAERRPRRGVGLTIECDDASHVLGLLLAAWRAGQLRQALADPGEWPSPFHFEEYWRGFAGALGRVILPRLDPLSSQIAEVVQMISDLRGLEVPVEATYPALASFRPELLPELSDRLRQSLASSRRAQADAGVEAVWWWLEEGRRLGLADPPGDLVREIAIAVSMRRPSLQQAFRAAEWMLRNEIVSESERFARLVAEGLGYLLEEARYEAALARRAKPGMGPTDITEVRILCVRMALALEHAGFGELHAVGEWIRQAQSDPFPEVRSALGTRDKAPSTTAPVAGDRSTT